MNYLQTILKREEEELTKRISREQQNKACPGNFYNLVKDDFVKCGLVYDEGFILSANTNPLKFIYLETKLQGGRTDKKNI